MIEQRLIDANELITAFPCGETVRTECVRATIGHMPTIEERKKGKWIVCTERVEETFHTGSRCSVCNYWKPMGIWNFCPNCGADMRGETNE